MAKNLNCKNCKNWDEDSKRMVLVKDKKVLFRVCKSPSMAISRSFFFMGGTMPGETMVISIGQTPILTHAKFYCIMHIKK